MRKQTLGPLALALALTVTAQAHILRIHRAGTATAELAVGLIQRLEVEGSSSLPQENGLPGEGFQLLPNYPNPANPSTTIQFVLPAAGRTTVRVYDINGRLVREVLDGVQPAGTRRVVWDGRDSHGVAAASGVYICSVESGGLARSRKLILVK